MTTDTTTGIRFYNLTGEIEVLTGLLIGGPEGGLEVGGIDNTFIRDLDRLPYIPGSSLKGKIRSLLEHSLNKVSSNGSAHSCTDRSCEICTMFGAGQHRDRIPERGPTRLLFRDARFTSASRTRYEEYIGRGEQYYETKTETAINRRTGAAENRSLRTSERVPPGARFDLVITLRVISGDSPQTMQNIVESGLRALENDYLGSSGSRGYGRVAIHRNEWQQAEL